MDAKTLQAELCKSFQINTQPTGTLTVVTPFTYEDGDRVVLFVAPTSDQGYRIDDNGEAASRLMLDGVDLTRGKAAEWVSSLALSYGVHWDGDQEELYAVAKSPASIVAAIARVAECSMQMQVLSTLRIERKHSEFKNEVLKVLREIEQESGIAAYYDYAADPGGHLIVDAYFLSQRPLAIVVATTAERLLEAQLIWSNARRHESPMRLFAVVEDYNKIGRKQMDRASYYTDKTVTYRNMTSAFREMISGELRYAH